MWHTTNQLESRERRGEEEVGEAERKNFGGGSEKGREFERRRKNHRREGG